MHDTGRHPTRAIGCHQPRGIGGAQRRCAGSMDEKLAFGMGMGGPVMAGIMAKAADGDGGGRQQHFGWNELIYGDLSLARQNSPCYRTLR